MQLTNIALATIFVTFLVTSFVRCSESDPARSEPTVAPYPSQQSTEPSALLEPAGESSVSSQSPMSPTSTLNPQTLTDFKDAVHGRSFHSAWNIYAKAKGETRRRCGEHLVNLGDENVVQMINGIKALQDKKQMLRIVFAYADQDLSNEIIDKVRPDDIVLFHNAGYNAELACNPGGFMTVVKRITNKDYQEGAIEYGVDALFEKDKTECIDPMISALQSKTSDPTLANVAFREAFLNASGYTDHRSFFVERFHDHPAISARNYSHGLHRAHKNGDPNYELFKWLIERADRDDLKEFMDSLGFRGLSSEDQEYVNNRHARIKDDPETRPKKGERLRREKREKVREVLEALEEFEGHSLPSALTNIIINEYGTD